MRSIRTDQGPLNVTIVRKGDDDSLVGDEILNGNLAFGTYDLCAPFGGMLALDRPELSLDDLQDACFFGNDVGEVFNGFEQGVVLLFNTLALETGELIEAQVENVTNLLFGEAILPFDNASLIAHEDSDLLDGFARPRERH